MSDQSVSPYRIQAVHDAFRVLESLVNSGQPMTAIEVAAATGISRNRSFRLLKTMEEIGYIRSVDSGSAHRPTLKLFSIGQKVASQLSVEQVARPVLEELCKTVNETVYLTTQQGDDVVCLITIESMQMVRITAQPGNRWPLGRGAAGEALLLGAEDAFRHDYLERHPEVEKRWPVVTEHFGLKGVTYVDGREGRTSDEGVIAMGIPIHGPTSDSNFAMCVTWPVTRVGVDIEQLMIELKRSAAVLKLEMGF